MEATERQRKLKMAESLAKLNEWAWLEEEIKEKIKNEYAFMKSYMGVEEYGRASESLGAIKAYESVLLLPAKTVKDNTTFFEKAEGFLRRTFT